jgi:hypothetical protein
MLLVVLLAMRGFLMMQSYENLPFHRRNEAVDF